MYDPALGRWHVMDPHSESYYGLSPFNYCYNNPLFYIDLFGLDPRYHWGKDGEDGYYYDDETGDRMSWDQVNNWIGDNNAGKEIWNSESGFQFNNFGDVESDNFSAAVGSEMGIPFYELGFGNEDDRQYIRTYMIGSENSKTALGKNSPLSSDEQVAYFKWLLIRQTNETGEQILPWVLGLPATIISGLNFPFAVYGGLEAMAYGTATNAQLNYMAFRTMLWATGTTISIWEMTGNETGLGYEADIVIKALSNPSPIDALSTGHDFKDMILKQK